MTVADERPRVRRLEGGWGKGRELAMCDHEHYNELRERVDALEDSVKVYHAKTDERIKTLFQTCEKLSDTATTVLKTALALLGTVLLVAVLALVYGAVGQSGFNAVTQGAAQVR